MTVASSRAAILAALEAVPDLNPTPATPAPIVAGSCWPVLSRAEPVNWCVDEGTWFVFVALPAGNNLAMVQAGDAAIDTLLPVFKTVGKVTAVEPWSWPVEAGGAAVPVIRFTLEA